MHGQGQDGTHQLLYQGLPVIEIEFVRPGVITVIPGLFLEYEICYFSYHMLKKATAKEI